MAASARELVNGAGVKRCTKGKSCGATCIDAQERCVLEFGPEIQAVLSKARDTIERSKKLASRDLEWTDEQAAKWTKANLKNIDNYMLDHMEGGKGSLWIIGNEPGGDRAGTEKNHSDIYNTLRKRYQNLTDGEFAKRWPELVEENAPLQARLLRQRMEDSKLVGKLLGQRVNYEVRGLASGITPEMLANGEIAKGWNIKEEVNRFGSVPGINSSTYVGKAIKLADAIGATKMSNTNVSWLPSPNESVWPWGKIFERAKMDPGPFKTRGSWIKHSIDKRGDLLRDKVLKEKPENVYVSGGNGKSVFDRLAQGGKPFQTEISWVSPNGNEKKAMFTVVKLGDSRIVHGPHFTAQMPKAVIEMRERLMKGERPENAVNVQAETPKPMKVSTAKIAKKAQKEMVSPSADVKKVPMTEWSTVKLKKAYEVAGRKDDGATMSKIVQILGDRGVRM